MTQVISSTLADMLPCMWVIATLVTLVSRICMKVTSITERVIRALREVGSARSSSRVRDAKVVGTALADADRHVRRHPGPERVRVAVGAVEDDLDRDALDDLDPVARRVLGGQEREAGARPGADGLDAAGERLAGEAVHRHHDLHPRAHARQLSLLEVGHHPDALERHESKEGLPHLHHLSHLDGLLGDNALHRSPHLGLLELQLGVGQVRLGLPEPRRGPGSLRLRSRSSHALRFTDSAPAMSARRAATAALRASTRARVSSTTDWLDLTPTTAASSAARDWSTWVRVVSRMSGTSV